MTDYKQEITGEKLQRFMARYNKASNPEKYYDTEEELCAKYGLDRNNLYIFFQRTGRLNDDLSHRDGNYIPKANLEFGPLVKANGTLNYYNPYWTHPFIDIKHKSNLEDCIRNSVVKTTIDGIKATTKAKKVKPAHSFGYLNRIFKVVDGKLGRRDQANPSKVKRIIDNPTGITEYGEVNYKISNLITALETKSDYVSRIPVVKAITTNISAKIAGEEKKQYASWLFQGYTTDGKYICKHFIPTEKDICALLAKANGLTPNDLISDR